MNQVNTVLSICGHRGRFEYGLPTEACFSRDIENRTFISKSLYFEKIRSHSIHDKRYSIMEDMMCGHSSTRFPSVTPEVQKITDTHSNLPSH